jgi:hypothetical protein
MRSVIVEEGAAANGDRTSAMSFSRAWLTKLKQMIPFKRRQDAGTQRHRHPAKRLLPHQDPASFVRRQPTDGRCTSR